MPRPTFERRENHTIGRCPECSHYKRVHGQSVYVHALYEWEKKLGPLNRARCPKHFCLLERTNSMCAEVKVFREKPLFMPPTPLVQIAVALRDVECGEGGS